MKTLTKHDAMNAHRRDEFVHIKATYANGLPLRARVNGKCKLWKTRPTEFQLPMKYGLYDCFYIDQNNAHEWYLPE